MPSLRRERSAGFVVFRDDPPPRVYLLLDYGRHWDFAKGHLRQGEDDLGAARRELREETGIDDIEPVQGFVRETRYQFRRGGRRVDKTVALFLGRTRSLAVTLSDEHVGYAFLPFASAVERLTFATARDVLIAAEQALRDRPA